MTEPKTTITARANDDPAERNIAQLLAQNWWVFAIRGVLGIIFFAASILLRNLSTSRCHLGLVGSARARGSMT